MDLNAVFAKTSLGEEAVQQRTRLVQRNLRTVLIVVDGRSTVNDLCEKVGSREVVEDALEQLERDGYIQPILDQISVVAPELPGAIFEPDPIVEESPTPPAFEAPAMPPSVAAPSSAPNPFHVPKEERKVQEAAPPPPPSGVVEKLQAILPKAPVEDDGIKPIRRGPRRQVNVFRWIGTGVLVLVLAIVVGIFVFPFGRYRADIELSLSTAFGQPVTVEAVRGSLAPTPILILAGVRIGDRDPIELREVRALLTSGSARGPHRVFQNVTVSGVTMPATLLPSLLERLPQALEWADFSVRHVNLEAVNVSLRDLEFKDYSGEFVAATGDKPARLALKNATGTLSLEMTNASGALELAVDAGGWKPVDSVPQTIDTLQLRGLLRSTEFSTTKFEARLLGGSVTGKFNVNWAGATRYDADLVAEGLSGKRLSDAAAVGFGIEGDVNAKIRAHASAEKFAQLAARTAVDSTIVARRGSVLGFDLVEASRHRGRVATRGGSTHYEDLTASLSASADGWRISALNLASGALHASGSLGIGKDLECRGNMFVQIQQGGTDIRVPLTVSGTTREMVLTGVKS